LPLAPRPIRPPSSTLRILAGFAADLVIVWFMRRGEEGEEVEEDGED